MIPVGQQTGNFLLASGREINTCRSHQRSAWLLHTATDVLIPSLKCVSVHGAVAVEEADVSHMPRPRDRAEAPLLVLLTHQSPVMVLVLHLACLHVTPPDLHHSSALLHEHLLLLSRFRLSSQVEAGRCVRVTGSSLGGRNHNKVCSHTVNMENSTRYIRLMLYCESVLLIEAAAE